MRKIIFLDMDGVLNSTEFAKRMPIQTIPNRNLYLNKHYGIDPSLAKNLKFILDKTNAEIVFSTSWRYFEDHHIVGPDWRQSLADILQVDKKIFIDNTPDLSRTSGWDGGWERRRGREIKFWIENNLEPGTFRYCVIDDEVVDIVGVIPEKNVIHTDMKVGLTMKDAEQAVKILNGD